MERRYYMWLPKRFPSSLRAFHGLSDKGQTAGSQSWKPVTLRAPLLLSIAAFTSISIAVMLYLSWIDHTNGGLAFASPTESHSTAMTFSYSYLPTLIALTLGTLWSWVDLDSKRLEPYFQLSKRDGAEAKDSLQLHYPFDFIALAPIRAFRRRHWSVFFSGTTTALIFWVLTPLLGAVFADIPRLQTINTSVETVANLVPGTSNTRKLDLSPIADGYGYTWLGQSLPAFVTATGAIAQFKYESKGREGTSNASITTTSDYYTTKLECTPAIIRLAPSGNRAYTFDNGKGCLTDEISGVGSRGHISLYIGYHNDPHVDWSLSYLGCPQDASHTFLAIWAEGWDNPFSNTTTNVTALFCEPSYFVQRVNVTILVSNNSVTDVAPVGPLVDLSQEHFNATDFEYLIGTGISAVSSRSDPFQASRLDQWPTLRNIDVEPPISNMVGFALGLTQYPPIEYFNPTTLASAYQEAHQLLFALAATRLFSSDLSSADSRPGLFATNVRAISVIWELAVVVEVILGLISIFILALLFTSWTRKSHLCKDPAALSDIMELARRSTPGTIPGIKGIGSNGCRYRLKLRQGRLELLSAETWQKTVTALQPENPSQTESLRIAPPDQGQNAVQVRPFEMTFTVGFAFLAILLLAIATLAVMYINVAKRNGLPLPSTNQVVHQLVLNYIPIAFATILEPFWTLLNRLLCILQPFEALRQGQARPSRSLDVKYTALSPQLVFWRALRAGHFTLVAVCLIGLSANFLAVSLGALFDINLVQNHSPFLFSPQLALALNGSSKGLDIGGGANAYKEHYYVARSNLSEGTALPPWIKSSVSLLPFLSNEESDESTPASYKAKTDGIGLSVRCTELTSKSTTTPLDPFNLTTPSFVHDIDSSPVVTKANADGALINCTTFGFRGLDRSDDVNATYAKEVVATMRTGSPTPSPKEQEECSRLLVVAFQRADLIVAQRPLNDTSKPDATFGALQATYMICEADLYVAPFDVVVNWEGRVEAAEKVGASSVPEPLLSSQENKSTFFENLDYERMWSGHGSPSWHNDVIAETWVPYLMTISMNSTDLINPNLPPPSAASIAPVIEDIITRLFAVILGLNAKTILLPAPEGSTIAGVSITTSRRVFMSRPMFIVSMVLLVLNVFVALLYYTRRPRKMLACMPTTIGSVLEMVEGSGLVEENADSKSREGWRVGYGRYVGTDGKPHIGIERRPFVVPWSGR
ncbi:MAG: hypothetical protein Q9183_002998 [Haloplaca sp. 2 TL-2023]